MTGEDKSRLRGLLQSREWKIVENVVNELCTKLQANPKSRDSEWETIKVTLKEEGMVEGIKNLIQELWRQAQ